MLVSLVRQNPFRASLDTVFGKSELTIIMAAAQINQSAWTLPNYGSVFTYVLAKELAGYSATADAPWITYSKLRDNVRARVRELCQKNGVAVQTPVFFPYSIRDDKPLAKRNEALLTQLSDAETAELEARPVLSPASSYCLTNCALGATELKQRAMTHRLF